MPLCLTVSYDPNPTRASIVLDFGTNPLIAAGINAVAVTTEVGPGWAAGQLGIGGSSGIG